MLRCLCLIMCSFLFSSNGTAKTTTPHQSRTDSVKKDAGKATASNQLSCATIVNCLKNTIPQNKLLRAINKEGLERRRATQKELQRWRSTIQEKVKKDYGNEARLAILYRKVVQILKEDKERFETLHHALQPLADEESYQLRTQKMGVVLTRMLDTSDQEQPPHQSLRITYAFFKKILKPGSMPYGFSIDTPLYNVANDPHHIYASGRGLMLKLTLFATLRALYSDKGALSVMGNTTDHPFVHPTPFPKAFHINSAWRPFVIERTVVSTGENASYLLVFHNGYAFGATRGEEEKEKKFSPHDCSSFIAHYAGSDTVTPTTKDLAFFYQEKEGFFFPDLGDSTTKAFQALLKTHQQDNPDVFKAMTQHMQTISRSLFRKPCAGWIWVKREYAEPKAEDTSELAEEEKRALFLQGSGGHTAFVICQKGAQVITLGANRNIEDDNLDGSYIIQVFDLVASESQTPFHKNTTPKEVIFYLKKRFSH